MVKFVTFDARPVLARGQAPLDDILNRLARLKPGQGLRVVAPFLPAPLIERLKSDGYACRYEPARSGGWQVYFWRDTQ